MSDPIVDQPKFYTLVDRGYQIIKSGLANISEIKNGHETNSDRMVCLLAVIANELIILNNKTPKNV